jgi:hypothetical protein
MANDKKYNVSFINVKFYKCLHEIQIQKLNVI